jgi:hypothetical protein
MLVCAGVAAPSSRLHFAANWVASTAVVVLPGILAFELPGTLDWRVLLRPCSSSLSLLNAHLTAGGMEVEGGMSKQGRASPAEWEKKEAADETSTSTSRIRP